MTAQNYGAGLIKRMNKCLASGIGIALVFGVSVCVYSQFLPETLTAFFTKDAAVVEMCIRDRADDVRGFSFLCRNECGTTDIIGQSFNEFPTTKVCSEAKPKALHN